MRWLANSMGSTACLSRVFSIATISVDWRQRLQGLLFGGRQRADLVDHDKSEARNQPRVLPVGLGAPPLGLAEGLDAARINDADRLQREAANTLVPEPADAIGDGKRRRLLRERGCCHGLDLYADLQREAAVLATVRSRDPTQTPLPGYDRARGQESNELSASHVTLQ